MEYHKALELLQLSPDASSQVYVEATAVVVDSVGPTLSLRHEISYLHVLCTGMDSG